MSGYNSRAIYRFKQRHISLLDFPSLVLRSTYTRVLGSLRIRTIATVHIALFAVNAGVKAWVFAAVFNHSHNCCFPFMSTG